MSKSAEYLKRLNKYGTDVEVHMIPSTDNKCTCWEYEWPNKDCPICNGTGYTDEGEVISVKAFVFPLRDSDKELDFINIGIAVGGQVMAYFSPDFDLDSAQYIIWDGIKYKVTGVDRALIADEMMYRSCHMDKVD
jgi:hypothetical protein